MGKCLGSHVRVRRYEIGKPTTGIFLDQRGDRLPRCAGEACAEPGGADRVSFIEGCVAPRLELIPREADRQSQGECDEAKH